MEQSCKSKYVGKYSIAFCYLMIGLAGVLSFLISDARAAVSGELRTGFMAGYQKTCRESQSSASVNRGVPAGTLASYCHCSAVYLADSLNNEFVKSVVQGENKIPARLVEMAAVYCQKNFQKY